MQPDDMVLPPEVRWRVGWLFRPSAWAREPPDGQTTAFRAMGSVGVLAPDADPRSWAFQLAPASLPPDQPVRLFANAVQLLSSRRGGPEVLCVLPEDGVLWGESALPGPPLLFSAGHEVRDEGELSWIDLPACRVCLVRRAAGAAVRFCLVAGAHDQTALVQTAETYLARDPHAFLHELTARRSAFWSRHRPPPARAPLVVCALEALAAALRAPQGPFRSAWSVSPGAEGESFGVNEILPLVSAWAEIDPEIAQQLVLSALARQQDDGVVPARCWPDGSVSENVSCWPLLAQAALRAWQARPDAAFLGHVAPRLHEYVLRSLRHFDPGRHGLPRWQSAEEAMLPETFEPQVASVELASFLLAEIEAVYELCGGLESGGPDPADLDNEQDRLTSSLIGDFWDQQTASFRDRCADGQPSGRLTIGSVMPLLTGTLDPRHRASAVAPLAAAGKLRAATGIASWERWPDDPEAPPVSALLQMIVMQALLRDEQRAVLGEVATTWWRTLLANLEAGGGLPETLDAATGAEGAAPRPDPGAWQPATGALAVRLQAATDSEPDAAPGASTFVRALDRHRIAVLAGSVTVLAVLVFGTALRYMSKETLTASTFEAMAGLAHRHYADGRYDEAIRLFERLQPTGRGASSTELMLGNALFRKGDLQRAEMCYRRVLERDAKSPPALMNLALALFRQNRLQEAAQCYRQVIELHGSRFPFLLRRARTCLELIGEYSGESRGPDTALR